MRAPFMLLVVVSLPALGWACAGTLEDPERFAVDSGLEAPDALLEAEAAACPDVPSEILAKRCGTGGCHSYADKVSGLDLESPNVSNRLVGICGTNGSYLIDPTTPTKSLIYSKLTSTPPFGGRMPPGPALDDPTTACVLSWITAQKGAPAPCGGSDAAPAADSAATKDAATD